MEVYFTDHSNSIIFIKDGSGPGIDLAIDSSSHLWDEYSQKAIVLTQVSPIPAAVSRFQARAALMYAGLLTDAEIAVSALGPLEQLAWSEATEWRRDSPTISAIAESLSLSDSDVDNLFIEAGKIVA